MDFQWILRMEGNPELLGQLDAETMSIKMLAMQESGQWIECDQTEPCPLASEMSFKKCLHHSAPLEYSVKFEILVQRHDYSQSSKRTEVLASRIVSGPLIPDTEYELPIKAESGLIGHAFVKLERFDHLYADQTPYLFRFSTSTDRPINATVYNHLQVMDKFHTTSILMESLIDHGLAVYKTWSARYPDVTGHIKIIRDSLLRGLEIRVQQLEFWAAYFKAGYLPTFQASRFVLKDVDNPNKEFRKSGFLWNCPWLTKESCIRRRGLTEASLVYRSYINQAIRIVNDKLYRKAYLIRNEIKALEHAASFSTSPEANYESVCKVKSNLYTICIDTNEFVSSVLQSVSADHLVFQPHIKDLSRLMGIIYNEVLPNLSGTSKKGSIKVGQLIGKLVGYIEEIVELGHRVLEIQGAILVNGLDGMAPIKKPWWSGLLYDSDSFELMRLLSICIQHTLKELRSEDSNSVVAFWDFIIRTGYPLILFSHIIPTEVNMAAFEDLAYRLMEMSKRVKVRMHSLSDDPYPKFQIDYLTLTVSIPVPESEYHTLSETMDQNGGISLLPILFLPKHARKVTLTGIERDGKSSAVTDKALAINRQSLRILTIYVKKIEKFSASNASQIQIGGLYGDLSTGLQVLDSEIQGRVHAFYENPNEKDIQTTLLASRCLTKLTASISSRFFPSSLLQPLPSVWIQNDDTKNPAALFTVQDADFMFDKFGVSIDCNWCVA